MTALSSTAIEGLRRAGIDPGLVVALGLREAEGSFDIPCERIGAPTVPHRWAVGGEPQPWPADNDGLGLWWPLGRDGDAAIICLGAGDALALASTLFSVGHDGAIRRRPNLPPLLADLTVACMPETAPGLPIEWVSDPTWGVDEFYGEVLTPERQTLFLAIPRGADTIVDPFVDQFVETGVGCELLPALALLPAEATWAELLAPFPGAARPYALAAILSYWELVARAYLPTAESAT